MIIIKSDIDTILIHRDVVKELAQKFRYFKPEGLSLKIVFSLPYLLIFLTICLLLSGLSFPERRLSFAVFFFILKHSLQLLKLVERPVFPYTQYFDQQFFCPGRKRATLYTLHNSFEMCI